MILHTRRFCRSCTSTSGGVVLRTPIVIRDENFAFSISNSTYRLFKTDSISVEKLDVSLFYFSVFEVSMRFHGLI